MQQPYDYSQLMAVICKAIKDKTGTPCVEANSVGPKPNYPFFTWDFVNAHQDIGSTDNTDEEVFEASIMFEAHSESATQALNLASWVRKLFATEYMDQLSAQNSFYVIERGDITDTNNIISVQIERRAGVQVDLRIKDTFKDDITPIETIELNGTPITKKD